MHGPASARSIVTKTPWDVVFIDGPSTERLDSPGRASSLFTTWHMLLVEPNSCARPRTVDVFVHDVNQTVRPTDVRGSRPVAAHKEGRLPDDERGLHGYMRGFQSVNALSQWFFGDFQHKDEPCNLRRYHVVVT